VGNFKADWVRRKVDFHFDFGRSIEDGDNGKVLHRCFVKLWFEAVGGWWLRCGLFAYSKHGVTFNIL
jgi:hypothetical protein